jgi:hypothetical protein
LNHWEVALKDQTRFDTDFQKLSDPSKEYVKDCIKDISKFKNPKTEYEYSVSCVSIPDEIILVRFPNGCETIIEMNGNTLFFIRAYDDIHVALND